MAEFKNPNASTPGAGGSGGGGTDMRSMLAFTVLALVALLAFQYFKPSAPTTPAQSQQQVAQTAAPANGSVGAPATAVSTPSAGGATVTASSETKTVVENELYRITFTNKGGRVDSWVLKHYRKESIGLCHSAPNIFNFPQVKLWIATCFNRTGIDNLDLVNKVAAEANEHNNGLGYPLEILTYEPALTAELNQALYQPSATGTVAAPAGISFLYTKGPLTVTKTFTFNESYVIDAKVAVTRNGSPVRALIAWPSGLGDQEEVAQYAQSKFAWSIDGKRDSDGPNKVSGNATLEQPYDYAAATDLYFAATFMPKVPARATIVTIHNAIDVPRDAAAVNGEKFKSPVLGVAMGDTSGVTETRLFAGPLQFDVLGSIHTTATDGTDTGEDLKPMIQFGFLKIIAEPLFLLLRLVYVHVVSNWGWAIILVTLFFNLLMLPTRFMMMKSSLKMQRVQPKMEAIKKKYAHLKATDPKRAEMNQETMQLYREEGINMYGGCLPLLVQMPLFFAYYRVLANVIELRQASWGWLPNLAVADPYHILPIIIICSMFLVQFITPSPGMDPSQRRMMAFLMPVVFGFSMWNYASGLALYWGTGNLLNLSLQLGINRSKMGRELQALAAKRAAKGNTKTIQGRR